MSKRSNPETRLQIIVCRHLATYGVKDLMFFHIKNSGKESPATGALLKKMGVRAGVSDLFIGAPGKPPMFLELKSHGNRPTKTQIAFRDHCEILGYNWAWADGIDSALLILRYAGAIRTAAPIGGRNEVVPIL